MSPRADRAGGFGIARHGDIALAAGLLGVLLVLIIPLSPWLLDLLLCGNITLAVTVLMVTIQGERPIELSAFPSLLLFSTLLRLALNVASTRLILLQGAAGRVIDAFGQFVVGGNYAVGAVVFLILVVIQFIVITKGAGRIAEVSARFTLDAMPGKQMAIDADLNAGLIDEDGARTRRTEIEQEASFYGAMDGASKFVRGDAVAGLVITAVNILGGLAIGVIQRGMPLSDAARKYTLLTIGDGLVSQIPALVIATASGVIVTRTSSASNLGRELTRQLLFHPKALYLVAGALGILAALPGVPFTPFAVLATGAAFMGAATSRARRESEEAEVAPPEEPTGPAPVETLVRVDTVELRLGYSLLGLVDRERGGDLLDRMSQMRRQFAGTLGLVIPPVRVRDSLDLSPDEYAVSVRGVGVATGQLKPGMYLAMDPGAADPGLTGLAIKEPAFGLDAYWIDAGQRPRAEAMGYTVVSPTAALMTHVGEVLRTRAADVLTRQAVQDLLDSLKEESPALVKDLVPGVISLGGVHRVLQHLLREQVSIRDLPTIIETVADHASTSASTDALGETVRTALGPAICEGLAEGGVLSAITLDPELEGELKAAPKQGGPSRDLLERVFAGIASARERIPSSVGSPVLLCDGAARLALKRMIRRDHPDLHVIAYQELSDGVTVRGCGVVGGPGSKAKETLAALSA